MTPAVVPAAGRSRRMGRPKLLLPWGETTVLGSLLGTLAAGGAAPVVVVIRRQDEALRREAEEHGAVVVANPDPDRGMLSSIRTGLEALAARLDPWPRPVLICPADLPAIRPETVRALLAGTLGPGEMAVPVHEGRAGHPLRLGEDLVPEVFRLDPVIGLRQLRELHPEARKEVATGDPGVLRDLDTPDDYEQARQLVF